MGRRRRTLMWFLCGALLGFGFLALLSIGLPVLVAGAVLAGVLARSGPADLAGAFVGAGAVVTAVMAAQRHETAAYGALFWMGIALLVSGLLWTVLRSRTAATSRRPAGPRRVPRPS